jgi:hypothetical protein
VVPSSAFQERQAYQCFKDVAYGIVVVERARVAVSRQKIGPGIVAVCWVKVLHAGSLVGKVNRISVAPAQERAAVSQLLTVLVRHVCNPLVNEGCKVGSPLRSRQQAPK